MSGQANQVPVYFFLGFRLLEAIYKRKDDTELKSFGVKIVESEFNQISTVHVMTAQFNMIFENQQESTFMFNAGFQINDLDWYHHIHKKQLDALFFSVVFPYIREKIHSLTNDYRRSIIIPTIDLRQADLSEGATFYKQPST